MPIHDILEAANLEFFKPFGIELQFLKNCPETVSVLADWAFEEWSSYDSTLTKEKLCAGFQNRLHENQLPLTLVALKNGTPVATISLKDRGAHELNTLSGGEPWLGSLQVVLKEQNQGLGTSLLKTVLEIAKCLGHKAIFLYTSNPENVSWYAKRGALKLDTLLFRNHAITLMKIETV